MQGYFFYGASIPGQRVSTPPVCVVIALEDCSIGYLRTWPAIEGRRPDSELYRIVIVCEDAATGRRAQRACRALADQFPGGDSPDLGVWRSDGLRDPKLQIRAMHEVAKAGLVILSVHHELPVQTEALLAAWLASRKKKVSTLVTMLDGSGHRSCAKARLTELARRHDLGILQQTVGNPANDESGTLELFWMF